ncbi:MAG: helix-turn-helix domain-containing protein [Myxococcota bacterium]
MVENALRAFLADIIREVVREELHGSTTSSAPIPPMHAPAVPQGGSTDQAIVPPAQPPEPTGPWLTAEEAARYLRLPTTRALYQCVRRGAVPCHRVGRRALRFHVAELDAVLQGGRADPALLSSARRPSARKGG